MQKLNDWLWVRFADVLGEDLQIDGFITPSAVVPIDTW